MPIRGEPDELRLGADRAPEPVPEDVPCCAACGEPLTDESNAMENTDGEMVCEDCYSGMGDDARDQWEDR